MSGYWANSWRNRLIGEQPDVRRRQIREVLGPQVSDVTTLEVANLDEPRHPLRLTLAYALRASIFYRYVLRIAGSVIVAGLAGVWLVERAFNLRLLAL